jgi:asparagine synthase (glutamine-hydrolysing)
MCGIAGGFGGLHKYDADQIANDIIREIRYRGPDGCGIQKFEHGFFVHLRLAIIDTSPGGAQPKWTSDQRYCITYNGEIYNYKELREELVALGCSFSTQSDTEVLLQAWQVWGKEGLKKCIGMFAFALYDTKERKLYLARDAFGIKPLYVAVAGEGVRFASTYPALARFPDCPQRVDAVRAFEFVRYAMLDQDGRTLVKGVRAVAPGTVEEWQIGTDDARLLGCQKLMSNVYDGSACDLTFVQAAEKLREAFLLSVRLHLRSDVPLGFALSGGLDSSAIVCAARLLEPDAELKTFTFRAQEKSRDGHDIDEGRWAAIVSDHTKSIACPVYLSGATAIDSLAHVVRTHGSPTSSMSPQAQYAVFQAAHEAKVTVMLDGQGADELFAGYFHHFGAALTGFLRRHEYAKAAAFVRSIANVPRAKWWLPLAWGLEETLPRDSRLLARRLGGYQHQPEWINAKWVAGRASGSTIKALGPLPGAHGLDALGDRLDYDLSWRSIPELLLYEDRNSMCHSIESRVPFLAAPVRDVAFSVPSHYHLGPDGISKRLFREAMRGILPEEIRLRRDKIGFEPPQGAWLAANRGEIDRLLRSDEARAIGIFNHDALLKCWQSIGDFRSRDFIYVWRWIGLILWTRAFQIDWA